MKKLKVSSKTVSLPTDFSTIETPIIENPSAKTTATKATVIASETKQISAPEPTPTPPAVPSIDTDAALKIEEADMMPEELPQSEKTGKLLYIVGSIIGILILSGVIILSVIYLRTPTQKPSLVETTLESETTPTPTLVSINKADITFEVLNGSGVSGAAAKAGTQIESLGYKIESLGNAEDTQTGTIVFIAENLTSQKETLMTNVKEEFPEAIYSGVLTGSSALVRIIIGK